MADLLVRLYDLPPLAPVLARLAGAGVAVRRALPAERPVVTAFARAGANPGEPAGGYDGWAAECEVAFARLPLACFVAVEKGAPRGEDTLVGFACYEATCRNFFGPELVRADRRGRGIGQALLLAALHAMRAEGYGYAIVGWASAVDFYRRALGESVAMVIEGSEPGIYRRPLKL